MTAIVVVTPEVAGNILVDCEAVTPSSENASFPKSFLTDGKIGRPFAMAAAAANDNIVFDLNRLVNGGFETWPALDPLPSRGWVDDSSGTGAIVRETSVVNTGGSTIAAKLTGGGAGNEARLRKTIRVIPGWAMTIALAIRGDGTNALNIYILNEETGKYLQSNETWTATKTAYATRNANTYNAMSTPADFTVEAASVGLRGVYTLRCWAEQVTGDGYVDDWFIWPHWDFGAVFGHNLSANITARVRSDNNAAMSSPTNRIVSFTLRRPSMWGIPAAMVTERYAQFYFEGTSALPIEATELLLAQAMNLPSAFNPPPYDSTPEVGLIGDEPETTSLREDESLSFPISLQMTESQWDDMRVRFVSAGRWGGRRTVLVPLDTRGEIHYGTFVPRSLSRMGAGAYYRLTGDFRELAYAGHAT